MGYLIGIDIGTSGAKTLLCDDRGAILASDTEAYPISSPKPLWSEQNPEDWWQAAVRSVRRVLRKAKVKGGDVQGVGLSGQMHGAVFLGASNRVLRPAILWNDQRTAEECHDITEKIGARRLIRLVCNPALTGFTAPKILWVRKHEPRVYEKTRRILLPKDYIRFRLSGASATEVSDASGTLLFDVKKRRWSKTVLSELGIDADLMPECHESEEVSAQVDAAVARQLGIPAGTPIVGGGGDQAAGAVGNGIVRPGVISATLGTSGVVFAYSEDVQTDPHGRVHTFCHAVRGAWHVMGVMLSAGGAFQWYRNQFAQLERAEAKRRKCDPYALLCEEAAKADLGSEGLVFLPYLTGERTPHADPDAKGAWIGLTPRHGKPHLIRSLLEGVTFGMRDSLEIIHDMGVPIRNIRVSGGGAVSPFWRQMQADIYGKAVDTINAAEGPAFGVALLAGVGTGAFKSVQEACKATIRTTTTTRPKRKAVATYNAVHPTFQKLYWSLKDDFPALSQLARSKR